MNNKAQLIRGKLLEALNSGKHLYYQNGTKSGRVVLVSTPIAHRCWISNDKGEYMGVSDKFTFEIR